MPVYNRRYLRQRLGQEWLRDTIVGTVTATLPVGSLNLQDVSLADPTMSGEQMYFRHWLRVTGPNGVIHDTRVASFNTGTGHFAMGVAAAQAIDAGAVFEVHSQLSPQEKDRALDAVIRDLEVQREIQVDAVDGARVYALPYNRETTNLITNPSGEAPQSPGGGGFVGVFPAAAFSFSSEWALFGRLSIETNGNVFNDTLAVAYNMNNKWQTNNAPHIFSVFVKTVGTFQLRAHMTGTVVMGDVVYNPGGKRLSLRFTSPPAGYTGTQLLILARVAAVQWDTALSDGWMCEEESSPYNLGLPSDYVDGDQPNCAWLGEPHASRSIRYAKGDYDILDVRYLADPTNSLNPDERQIPWFRVDATASEGKELRIAPALRASQKLILDTIQAVRLGEHDLAAVDMPSADLVLAGAAARCLWLLEQRSPGQEAARYRERRLEAARQYTKLAARFRPAVTRRIMLDEPW